MKPYRATLRLLYEVDVALNHIESLNEKVNEEIKEYENK